MHTFLAVLLLTVQASSAATTPVENPWEEISNDEGILVSKRDVEGSPVVAFRGETVMEVSAAKVMSVLYDTSRKLQWVARAVETKDIRQLGDYERVEYNHTATPWPLTDRDFVFHVKVEIDTAGKRFVVRMKSIEDPTVPEADCCVRAQLMESKYIITPVEGGKKSKVEVEIHADPKGAVPKWIVNLFQKSWPHRTLEGIKKQATREDVKEHPLYVPALKSMISGG